MLPRVWFAKVDGKSEELIKNYSENLHFPGGGQEKDVMEYNRWWT